MHQAFNFDFLDAHWDATALQHGHRGLAALQRRRRRPDDVGAVEPRRRAPRLAARPRPVAGRAPTASAPTTRSRMPCSACAARAPPRPSCSRCPAAPTSTRARSSGLPEHTTMPDAYRQDPTFHRTQGRSPAATAAGCRCRGSRTPRASASGPGATPVAAPARRLRRPRRRPAGRRRGLDPRALPRPARPPPHAPARPRQPHLGRAVVRHGHRPAQHLRRRRAHPARGDQPRCRARGAARRRGARRLRAR